MEQIEWLDIASPYHVTIKDILSVPVGEPVKLLFICRNIFDLTSENAKGVSMRPSDFFRKCYQVEFVRTEGIKGIWKSEDKTNEREFDIFLENLGFWFPLVNNRVPDRDYQGVFDLSVSAGKHYSELPETTKLGWRGPMIFKDKIDELPNVVLF